MEDPIHRDGFLRQINEQSDRLHALILDLLSLARIESEAEAFEPQAVSLAQVVSACQERHRARAEANNQVLQAAPAEGESSAVVAWADADAIGEILDNLVDNALKYTPQGGEIQIKWWAEKEQVCLEVQDTGIGIPQRDLARIFERFYRVDKARSRELGGTGLGLSIVKHLAQAMRGSIEARSQLGKGSAFLIRLPKAPAV
jgi:two-component system phosphate regulon sensor histidine kinase PhoR